MHLDIFCEFQNRNMSGYKSIRKFSRMAHDPLHEQNNKLLKNTSYIIKIQPTTMTKINRRLAQTDKFPGIEIFQLNLSLTPLSMNGMGEILNQNRLL